MTVPCHPAALHMNKTEQMQTQSRRALFVIPSIIFSLLASQANAADPSTLNTQLHKMEADSGGIISLSVLDTANNQTIQYHADRSMPMGCTSKVIGVAAILQQSMHGKINLQARIHYRPEALSAWSPISKQHLADGMTIEQLSAAAISYSDNTAMNLLAQKIGGPAGITRFARAIGDSAFNLTDDWPAEAKSGPGEHRNDSTANAMTRSLQKLLLGNILSPTLRQSLQQWMVANTTGNHRIRAGTPKGWIVADKTGTGSQYGTTNDTAVLYPPSCQPVIITVFYSSKNPKANKREDIVAEATRLAVRQLAAHNSCIARQSGLKQH